MKHTVGLYQKLAQTFSRVPYVNISQALEAGQCSNYQMEFETPPSFRTLPQPQPLIRI